MDVDSIIKSITLKCFPRNDALVFKSPANILVAGCSQSGKTYFTQDLLIFKERLFVNPPQKIIIFYREWQKVYDNLKQHFSEQISFKTEYDSDELKNMTNCILVFDDFLSKMMFYSTNSSITEFKLVQILTPLCDFPMILV